MGMMNTILALGIVLECVSAASEAALPKRIKVSGFKYAKFHNRVHGEDFDGTYEIGSYKNCLRDITQECYRKENNPKILILIHGNGHYCSMIGTTSEEEYYFCPKIDVVRKHGKHAFYEECQHWLPKTPSS